jgi:hypothetical protein
MSPHPSAVAPSRLTLDALARLHGDHSAAMMLLLVAFLSLTPLVGVSWLILLIASHWHRPDGAIAIPARMGRLQLSPRWSQRCERGLHWAHAWARRRLRTRWTALLAPATHRAWGLWIGLMGVVTLLPLPLANLLPGASLMLLSLGWIGRDGLALAAAVVVGVAGLVYIALMGHWLVALAQEAIDWLRAVS